MTHRRSLVRQTIRIAALALTGFVLANRRSLAEGLRYLWQMLTWHPEAIRPIARDGPFGSCYDLVRANNAARCQIIIETLRGFGLEPVTIPVPDEPLPDLLVRFHPQGPYTLFIAHYDKSRETPAYQGASDNTAAVSVLLAVARDLLAQQPNRAVALLFTAAEERGLKGAYAFRAWAQQHDVTIAEVVNLDMLGRDRLAVRPSALPGFYFWLPLLGELVYDGRRFRKGQRFALPDRALVRRLAQLMPADIIIYERFTAYSDSNVFQDAGVPTVTMSSDNMYYLDLVWERDRDRVEWLDERNLALARQLILGVATA